MLQNGQIDSMSKTTNSCIKGTNHVNFTVRLFLTFAHEEKVEKGREKCHSKY